MGEKLRTWAPVTLFFAVAIAAVVLVVNAKVLPADDKYVVYGKFDDAGGVLKNSAVKVNNIAAGSVEKIWLDENDDVVLRMELDEGVGPVGEGVTAAIRPVNLLGEKYVDLEVGDESRPLEDGSTIPKSATSLPVEIDDLLNTFDPSTRTALRIIINEAGISLMGRGTDFNQTITDLPPALDEAKEFVADVERDNLALQNAIVAGDRVVAEMSEKRDDLGALVESAARSLTSVAERRDDLGRTLQSAPPGLRALGTTLGELEVASDELVPATRDLRAASPSLARALSNADGFVDAARPALEKATDVAPSLARLGRESTPTIERLRPTALRMASFARDVKPILTTLDRDRGLYELLDFMHGWADVISNQDGLGHVFRLRFTFDPELLNTVIDRYTQEFGLPAPPTRAGGGQPAREVEAPSEPAPPVETVEDLPDAIQDLLDKLPANDVKDLIKQFDDTVKDKLPPELLPQLGQALEGDGDNPAPLLDYLLGS